MSSYRSVRCRRARSRTQAAVCLPSPARGVRSSPRTGRWDGSRALDACRWGERVVSGAPLVRSFHARAGLGDDQSAIRRHLRAMSSRRAGRTPRVTSCPAVTGLPAASAFAFAPGSVFQRATGRSALATVGALLLQLHVEVLRTSRLPFCTRLCCRRVRWRSVSRRSAVSERDSGWTRRFRCDPHIGAVTTACEG